MRLSVVPYSIDKRSDWDRVVKRARNATFLHERSFMEYHSGRFEDASVLICNDAGYPRAVLPANCSADTVYSHEGLTYGALLMPVEIAQLECIEAFEAILKYYAGRGVRRLLYKPVPHIFHKTAAEEDLYALVRVGAKLIRRDVSCAIDQVERLPYSKGRKWSVNKATRSGILAVSESSDLVEFHSLLACALARHNVSPVHSVDELRFLRAQFPGGIRFFEARREKALLAGALTFDFGGTVHTQYLAVSDEGREVFALDYLVDRLLNEIFATRRYFSFGISTEQQGLVLNEGLQRYKEGFGARAVVHDLYELEF